MRNLLLWRGLALPGLSSKLKVPLLLLALVASGTGAWFFYPIRADLRTFDPVRVGEAEASMWRHYYEPRHGLLALDVYRTARRAYGVSPFDSLRLTWNAARAASLFHGTGNRERHRAAEAHLRRYYGVIAAHLRSVDAAEAARLELQWWRQHRSRQYETCARTLAALSAVVYGGDQARYEPAAKQRVEAMVLCDARQKRALDGADWAAIRGLLIASYQALADSIPAQAAAADAPVRPDGNP